MPALPEIQIGANTWDFGTPEDLITGFVIQSINITKVSHESVVVKDEKGSNIADIRFNEGAAGAASITAFALDPVTLPTVGDAITIDGQTNFYFVSAVRNGTNNGVASWTLNYDRWAGVIP